MNLLRRKDIAPATLAYHLRLGNGAAEDVLRYSMAAAREAEARVAYADAVRHWEHALAAGPEPSVDLVLELADARRRAGQGGPAREAYGRATRMARVTGDADALARAALGLHALGDGPQDLLAEAAEALPRNSSVRARVLAAGARVLAWAGRELDRAGALADEAVAVARTTGDPATLGLCLVAAHHVHSAPGAAAQRLALADEIVALATAHRDPELLVEARLLRVADLLELADPRFPAELDEFLRAADASGQPGLRYLAGTRRAMRAMMRGDFELAGRLVEEYAALGREIGVPDAGDVRTTQRWELLAAHDRLAELAGEMATAFPDPDSAPRRAYEVFVLLGRGERERAERLARTMPLSPTAGMARPGDQLSSLVRAAQLCAALGVPEFCAQAYDLLAPYAGQAAVFGVAAAFAGAVDHHLGALAAALGREALARGHFRDAVEIHERLGAPYWARLSRQALPAEATLRRDGTQWTVEYAGRTVKVRHAKGMADLAILLARPGTPVSAVELAGIEQALGGDPLLDDRAKRELRQRLATLENGEERDAILAMLTAAVGLGGRDRRLGDQAERARKAVTARIRDALSTLDTVHPELGRHLRASLTTGSWCSYQTESRTTWRVSGGPLAS